MKMTLEPNLELQLGLKEKRWQLDHHRVLLSDTENQVLLLERLLDEAATLYNRTQDSSVDSEAQERLKDSYEEIRTKAQDILKSVKSEEKTLQHIERLAEAVKNSTSPLGAEKITKEVEELRQAWESLRLACEQEQERLENTVRIQSEYTTKVLKMKSDMAELRKLVQKLNQDLEFKDVERTEEQMVALWRKFMIKLQASEHAIYEHECFHGNLLNLEHWLMETKQKLELFRSSNGEWNIENHQAEVQELRSRISMGQDLFQSLLKSKGTKMGADAHLEDLRYQWMLYKSKLKDVGDLRVAAQKRSGFLYRVCCAALPLQLLLLALLLLAFLLPLVDEGASCSLANNFARSFNLMLRYDGPPPT
ncbi:UNVERIFIED_CONTAM: hypothetical protein FKN15_032912 [Acipenser sinensis]